MNLPSLVRRLWCPQDLWLTIENAYCLLEYLWFLGQPLWKINNTPMIIWNILKPLWDNHWFQWSLKQFNPVPYDTVSICIYDILSPASPASPASLKCSLGDPGHQVQVCCEPQQMPEGQKARCRCCVFCLPCWCKGHRFQRKVFVQNRWL